MDLPQLVLTADGSSTIYLREIDEHYHSTFGAVQESEHVFIKAGLHQCHKSSLTIFEVGFGTGLNAYLTLLETMAKPIFVHYLSVEKFPLSFETWSGLNYPLSGNTQNIELFSTLHLSPWNEKIGIAPNFDLTKFSEDLNLFDFNNLPRFDLIYFDAFSPDKQPEMWTLELFKKLSDQCNEEAIIVTYCAKGAVRRMMKEAGFMPERIPGPPGKREMLRGTKSK